MQIKSKKASKPIVYVLVFGFGLGVAIGIVRSAHLSKPFAIMSGIAVLVILWLIYRQGKASAHAEAQAWAQSVATAAAESYSVAEAKAQALSEAYSMAISQANATATNTVNVSLPALDSYNNPIITESLKTQEIEHSGLYSDDKDLNERSDVQSHEMAIGDDRTGIQLDSQKS